MSFAAKGLFIGTSSWKYEGWRGQLYTPCCYEYRGKVAVSPFERECLKTKRKVRELNDDALFEPATACSMDFGP